MATTKEEYFYLDPTTQRWGMQPARGAALRLKATLVFSWREYNENAIERRNGEGWEVVSGDDLAALIPIQQGHQWTFQVVQKDDGSIVVAVRMVRIADTVFQQLSGFDDKFVMKLNYTMELTEKSWARLAVKARAFGVDLLDLAVDMAEAEEAYQGAREEWERLTAYHQRAIALARDTDADGLLEIERLVDDGRHASNRYVSCRATLTQLLTALEQEPGRLPEKALLRAHVQELPAETPLGMIVSLSKAATADHAVALRMATPRERQAALIAQLLNDFYGSRLAEPRGETLVLYDPYGRPAGVITKGSLEPYREGR